MSRLFFVKAGVAVWSSHLDLMRALMRSFRRAGIDLKHSQGFTPHPELSILMPLSVGVESQCEIAEFTLAEGCVIPAAELAARLNPVLPAGLRALDSYEGGAKAGKLAWLRARLVLEYDGGMQNTECRMQNEGSGSKDRGSENGGREAGSVGAVIGHPQSAEGSEMQDAECKMKNEGSGIRDQGSGDGGERILRFAQNDRIEALRELFARTSLVVEKHSKKGDVELDIAPRIRSCSVGAAEPSPACRGGGPASRPVEGCRPQPTPVGGMQNEGSGIKDQGSENEGERILRFAQNDSLEPVPYGAQNALTRDEECGFLAPLGMTGGDSVVIEAVVAAQNPTLNPLLLVTAIEKYLPEHKPDFVQCRRLEIYDADLNVFR